VARETKIRLKLGVGFEWCDYPVKPGGFLGVCTWVSEP